MNRRILFFRKNTISILCLTMVVAVLFLGIGYARISAIPLNITGNAQMDRQTGVVLSKIQYANGHLVDPSSSTINTYYKTLMDSTIVLGQDSSSFITYNISVKNLTNIDYMYSGVVYDQNFYDNDLISFQVSGINHGDSLVAGEEKTFQVTFQYAGSDVSNNVLNSYLNFKFSILNAVTVQFNTHGGTVSPDHLELGNGDTLGELPTPTKELCESNDSNLSYRERNCSYVGNFEGWYLDSDYTTPVGADYVVTSDIILHAKWHSVYEHYSHLSLISFNGVDDSLDTGVNPFSEENLEKDFDLSFDLIEVDEDFIRSGATPQPTIMNAKDETNSTYPGFVVRFNTSSVSKINTNSRWNNSAVSKTFDYSASELPIHYEFKRREGVVTFTLTGQSNSIGQTTLFNQSNWALDRYFSRNIIFGSSYNSSGTNFRFFKGSLSNIEIELFEP